MPSMAFRLDSVGNRIAQHGDVALGHISHHGGRGGVGAGSAASSQVDGRMEFENEPADQWCEQHGHRCGDHTTEQQANTS